MIICKQKRNTCYNSFQALRDSKQIKMSRDARSDVTRCEYFGAQCLVTLCIWVAFRPLRVSLRRMFLGKQKKTVFGKDVCHTQNLPLLQCLVIKTLSDRWCYILQRDGGDDNWRFTSGKYRAAPMWVAWFFYFDNFKTAQDGKNR